MKTFKTIDVWLSISLLCISLTFSLLNQEYFYYGYFIVGGWQVISMIVHEVQECFIQQGGFRRRYHKTVGILAIITLVCCILLAGFSDVPIIGGIAGYTLLIELFVLLFAAPVMAVVYTVICYNEVNVKMKRPLSLLK